MDDRELDVKFDMELLVEWLKHPVTKILAIALAAELARQLVIHHGVKLLGLVSDETGEV